MVLFDTAAPSASDPLKTAPVSYQTFECPCYGVDVAVLEQDTSDPVLDHVWDATYWSRYDGQTSGHSLKYGDGHAFFCAWQTKDVGFG